MIEIKIQYSQCAPEQLSADLEDDFGCAIAPFVQALQMAFEPIGDHRLIERALDMYPGFPFGNTKFNLRERQ